MIHRLLEAVAERLRDGFAGTISAQRIVVGAEPERDINLYAGDLVAGGKPEREEVSGRLRVTRDITHALFLAAHASDAATVEQRMALAMAMIATERERLLVAFNQGSPYQAGAVSALCQLDHLELRGQRPLGGDGHLEASFAISGKLVLEREIEATGTIETITLVTENPFDS